MKMNFYETASLTTAMCHYYQRQESDSK